MGSFAHIISKCLFIIDSPLRTTERAELAFAVACAARDVLVQDHIDETAFEQDSLALAVGMK